jgi:hypothetical protein
MTIIKIYRRGESNARTFVPRDAAHEPESVIATDRSPTLDVEWDRITLPGIPEPFSPVAILVAARSGMFGFRHVRPDATGPGPAITGNVPPAPGTSADKKARRRKKPNLKETTQ